MIKQIFFNNIKLTMDLNDFNFEKLLDSIESEFSRNKYNYIGRYDRYGNGYNNGITDTKFIIKKIVKNNKIVKIFKFINQINNGYNNFIISITYNNLVYFYDEHDSDLFFNELKELICLNDI